MMVFHVAEHEVPCRYALLASEFVFTRSIYLDARRHFETDCMVMEVIGLILETHLLISRPNRIDMTEMAYRNHTMRSAVPCRNMTSDHA
jgi:hypothetical protein